MGCFSLGWLEQVLVWLVVVGAIFAIIKLLVPLVLSAFPGGGTLAQIINIILWTIIVIMIIYIAFSLISCLGGSSIMPPLPHGR